jgi:hypothetical protein
MAKGGRFQIVGVIGTITHFSYTYKAIVRYGGKAMQPCFRGLILAKVFWINSFTADKLPNPSIVY